MHCVRIQHGDLTGVVCSSRRSAPRCSTPGCRRKGRAECDYAVERNHPEEPKRGDARLHLKHQVIFYVWRVTSPEVTISMSPPGGGSGVPQTVSITDWWAKTSATCDLPVCDRCAVAVGKLDFCAAHGRAAQDGGVTR